MPPKVNKAEPVAVEAAPVPKIDIKLRFNAALSSVPYTSIHARVISEFFDCITTEVCT
jgi:hypothetical protein